MYLRNSPPETDSTVWAREWAGSLLERILTYPPGAFMLPFIKPGTPSEDFHVNTDPVFLDCGRIITQDLRTPEKLMTKALSKALAEAKVRHPQHSKFGRNLLSLLFSLEKEAISALVSQAHLDEITGYFESQCLSMLAAAAKQAPTGEAPLSPFTVLPDFVPENDPRLC